jgi:MYXO-CTERM domain-containing protein
MMSSRALRALPLVVLALAAAASPARAQETPLVFEGNVPDDADDFFDLVFEVPAGIAEIQVSHRPTQDGDILDWGLYGPDGFRGYGGGNLEDAIVGEEASSRSYLPGPITPGTWRVTVGKAKLVSAQPGYHVEIVMRAEATLPPATDRAPYVPAAPLVEESRFFAGDLHVHSADSGDARPPLQEIADFAIGKGLDFVVVTDHNTNSHIDRIVPVQEQNPELLLVPGVEFTTYGGHATGFGATEQVDARIGHEGRTVEAAIEELTSSGALFSINHPALDVGDLCIGCAWTHAHPVPGTIHGVEIETGGFRQAGFLFADEAIAFWETLLDEGHHVAALGGSDDHQAGTSTGSPIGDPTTMIFAANLSVASLRTGIQNSRTVVKLQGPDDPMIVLDTNPARTGDTATSPTDATPVVLTATVTGGVGTRFRFVKNGLGVDAFVDVTEDPQVFTLEIVPDATGTQRIRAEVTDPDETPRTITSYVWLRAGPPEAGCACRGTNDAPALLAAIAVLFLSRTRTRRALSQARAPRSA